MRVRPLVVRFAAVVSLLVVACAPEPKDAKNPGCVIAAARFTGCAVDMNVDSPEKLQAMRQTSINRRVMRGLFTEHHIDLRDAEALGLW